MPTACSWTRSAPRAVVVGAGGAAALLLAARRQRTAEIALKQKDRDQADVARAHALQERVAAETQAHQQQVAQDAREDAAAQRITELYTQAVEQLGSWAWAERTRAHTRRRCPATHLARAPGGRRRSATAVITGHPLDRVRGIGIGDLSEDAATLTIYEYNRHTCEVFTVPEHVRGVLRAARAFRLDGGTQPDGSGRLFSHAGLTTELLHEASAAGQVPLPGELGQVPETPPPASWHRLVTGWWVGDPLHGPVHQDPQPKWDRHRTGWPSW